YKRLAGEGIDLVEPDNGRHKPIAHLRRGNRSAHAHYEIDVVQVQLRAYSLHQLIEVCRVTRLHDVGVQALNCEHPAHLPGQVAVLRLRENRMEYLLIGLSRRLGSACDLSKLFFHAESWKTRLDPTKRVNVWRGHGSRRRAGRTRRLFN